MKNSDSLALPPSPNLVIAFRAGFDAIANHVALIAFPVSLDLLLWLGPRLRLTELIRSMMEQLIGLYSFQDAGMTEMLEAGKKAWLLLAEQFNLLAALRSYPVGVPSLMVSKLPMAAPLGGPVLVEIHSMGGAFLAWGLISLFGLVIGTLYFAVVAQVALFGEVNWRQALSNWPWASLQVLFLALFWAVVILAVSIPGSFIVTLVAFSGFSFGQCALLLYAGFVFWLILPIVFSPHGIIANQYKMFTSIKVSVNLMRKTLPTTVLFLLAVFLLSKGLNILWLIPAETSWFTLVGIIGHAFVTTGLLAASFVYYRDALQWVSAVFQPKEIIRNA